MDRQRGYCGKPEWADEQPCPMMDTEEIEDCTECEWYRENEE